jgi:hypothetical protein
MDVNGLMVNGEEWLIMVDNRWLMVFNGWLMDLNRANG